MKKQATNEQRYRCLRPSLLLYGAVTGVIFIVCLFVALICSNFGWALVVAGMFGATPLVLVRPLAFEITRQAEYKKVQPNNWFVVDLEKEMLRYGPIRARRMAKQDGIGISD